MEVFNKPISFSLDKQQKKSGIRKFCRQKDEAKDTWQGWSFSKYQVKIPFSVLLQSLLNPDVFCLSRLGTF